MDRSQPDACGQRLLLPPVLSAGRAASPSLHTNLLLHGWVKPRWGGCGPHRVGPVPIAWAPWKHCCPEAELELASVPAAAEPVFLGSPSRLLSGSDSDVGKMPPGGLDVGVDMKPAPWSASCGRFHRAHSLPFRARSAPATGRAAWKLILGVTKLRVLGKFRSHCIPPVSTPSCLPS